MSETVIVGGGIIGCATAYELLRKGRSVTLLEARELGAGGSSRNGGGVRQSARDNRELPLAMHAVRNRWPKLSEELRFDLEYVCQGNLRLARRQEHLAHLEAIVERSSREGLEVEMVEGNRVREICPPVDEGVIGASWCPTDGHANPMRTTLAYGIRARELGGRIETGVEVTRIRRERGKVTGVESTGGFYPCDTLILACGLQTNRLLRSLGLSIPMVGRTVEVVVTDEQKRSFDQMLGTAASDFYGHQTAHGSFVFGGMSGLEPFLAPEDPNRNHPLTASAISRAVLDYFPFLETAQVVRSWAGELAVSADGVPVISRVESVEGLVIATAFSGHGFGIAPAVGESVAALAAGERPPVCLEPFGYDRFAARV
ncbi:MAG: NAD(P)/FAD-dependent oxidoreductase [Alkalispirochaetaceae bacterium]